MKAALEAALAGRAALVFADGTDSVPATIAALRSAAPSGDMKMLVIAPTVPKLDRAMLLAVVEPLAEEFAPGMRCSALDLAHGAEPDDVVAAAVFLLDARSTTGQPLRIIARA